MEVIVVVVVIPCYCRLRQMSNENVQGNSSDDVFELSRLSNKSYAIISRRRNANQWGPVTFNAPDGAGTQLRYSPRTAACLRLRCHCHFLNRST